MSKLQSPLEKGHPPLLFPSNHPLKFEILSSPPPPPLSENLTRGSTTRPLPPAKRGWGWGWVHTMDQVRVPIQFRRESQPQHLKR